MGLWNDVKGLVGKSDADKRADALARELGHKYPDNVYQCYDSYDVEAASILKKRAEKTQNKDLAEKIVVLDRMKRADDTLNNPDASEDDIDGAANFGVTDPCALKKLLEGKADDDKNTLRIREATALRFVNKAVDRNTPSERQGHMRANALEFGALAALGHAKKGNVKSTRRVLTDIARIPDNNFGTIVRGMETAELRNTDESEQKQTEKTWVVAALTMPTPQDRAALYNADERYGFLNTDRSGRQREEKEIADIVQAVIEQKPTDPEVLMMLTRYVGRNIGDPKNADLSKGQTAVLEYFENTPDLGLDEVAPKMAKRNHNGMSIKMAYYDAVANGIVRGQKAHVDRFPGRSTDAMNSLLKRRNILARSEGRSDTSMTFGDLVQGQGEGPARAKAAWMQTLAREHVMGKPVHIEQKPETQEALQQIAQFVIDILEDPKVSDHTKGSVIAQLTEVAKQEKHEQASYRLSGNIQGPRLPSVMTLLVDDMKQNGRDALITQKLVESIANMDQAAERRQRLTEEYELSQVRQRELRRGRGLSR